MGRFKARSKLLGNAFIHRDDSLMFNSDGIVLDTYRRRVPLTEIGIPLARGRITCLHVYAVIEFDFLVDSIPSAPQTSTWRHRRKEIAPRCWHYYRDQWGSKRFSRPVCTLVRKHLSFCYALGASRWTSDAANYHSVFQLRLTCLYNSFNFRALEERSRMVPQNIANLLLHIDLHQLCDSPYRKHWSIRLLHNKPKV